MHRLHGLPLAVVEERFEVLTRRLALRMAREAVRELIGKLSEPSQDRSSGKLAHAQKGTKFSS